MNILRHNRTMVVLLSRLRCLAPELRYPEAVAFILLVVALSACGQSTPASLVENTTVPDNPPGVPKAMVSSGDVNLDGIVDSVDLGIVASNLGPLTEDNSLADVNQDGVVDLFDLNIVAREQGRRVLQPLQPMVVEPAFPNLSFQGLTYLTQPNGSEDRIYVIEQVGHILDFQNEPTVEESNLFLDITDRVNQGSDEEGLLGLAFDPGYQDNGYFYLYYSATDPRRSVLSRFSVREDDPSAADPDSELVILEVGQPFRNHNGGQIEFGPEGYLYVGVGDGGGGGDPLGNGQSQDTLLGSVLRIDVTDARIDDPYRVPPDNPYVGVPGARDEIWAYGLRNPWRFSFDPENGHMWLADVGQNQWEEVNVVEPGSNYGWNIMEGAHCFQPATNCDRTGLALPVAEYSHSDGCSITGGYVYRGLGTPSLSGAYVYGDFCSGKIWGFRYANGVVTEHLLLVDSDLNITSFGQDQDNNLYILDQFDGIYRLVPAGMP